MPLTQTSLLLTTTEGAEAVDGALSITVLPVVFEDTVLDAVVLDTVFDDELTVFDDELTVFVVLVVVTVSVAFMGAVERTNARATKNSRLTMVRLRLFPSTGSLMHRLRCRQRLLSAEKSKRQHQLLHHPKPHN